MHNLFALAPSFPPPAGAPTAPRALSSLSALDERFADFLRYSRTSLGHSPDTLRGYRGTYGLFRRYLASPGETRTPIHLDISTIEGWVAWNRERGLSPITVNTYFRQLRPFFHDLERRDGQPNPFRSLRPPRTPRALPRARTPEECRRILDAARSYPWRSDFERRCAEAMLGIVLYAGLRRSEVLRLQVMDVDLVAGTLHINRGKGPGGGTDRTAYVPPALGLLIEAYLIARRKRRCIVPELFVCERSRRAISLSTFRRTVAAVRAAADVPFSLHSLRHSYVTMLLRSGVPIHVAQDLAGHRKITTTAQYLEVWDEDRKNAVGAIRY